MAQVGSPTQLSKDHATGRMLAKRTCLNSKATAYLTSKLEVRQAHNFTGGFIERMELEQGKVVIYDTNGQKIKEKEGAEFAIKPATTKQKDKPSPKLSDASDEKPSKSV